MVYYGTGNARGKEAVYAVTTRLNNSYFFGRENTTPEKAQDLIGREFTEQELDDNNDQFVRDYFLCTGCEKRLSILEGLYSELFNSTISSFRKLKANELYLHHNSEVFYLLFYSILWRLSYTNILEFKFPESVEESLRKLLNDTLKNTKEDLLVSMKTKTDAIFQRPLWFGIVEENNIPTANIVTVSPTNQAPYSFALNEYIVFFYNKTKSVNNEPQTFFGMEKAITKKTLSSKKTGLILNKIPGSAHKLVSEGLLNKLVEQHKRLVAYWFVELHKKIKGTEPSAALVAGCMAHIWNKDGDHLQGFVKEKIMGKIAEYFQIHCLNQKK